MRRRVGKASEGTPLEFEVVMYEAVVHNFKLEEGGSIMSWSVQDLVLTLLRFRGNWEIVEDVTKVVGKLCFVSNLIHLED